MDVLFRAIFLLHTIICILEGVVSSFRCSLFTCGLAFAVLLVGGGIGGCERVVDYIGFRSTNYWIGLLINHCVVDIANWSICIGALLGLWSLYVVNCYLPVFTAISVAVIVCAAAERVWCYIMSLLLNVKLRLKLLGTATVEVIVIESFFCCFWGYFGIFTPKLPKRNPKVVGLRSVASSPCVGNVWLGLFRKDIRLSLSLTSCVENLYLPPDYMLSFSP